VSCLDPIIIPSQSAFVPTRSIAEIVLLAQDVVKDYHKNEGKARCSLKVDLMKAYDTSTGNFFFFFCFVSVVLDSQIFLLVGFESASLP
jgi:hypothetical protein